MFCCVFFGVFGFFGFSDKVLSSGWSASLARLTTRFSSETPKTPEKPKIKLYKNKAFVDFYLAFPAFLGPKKPEKPKKNQ